MIILFDRSFPKSLLDALRLVLNINKKNTVTVAFFDETIHEETLENPVVFLMDESRNGVDNQVRLHVDSGYRVFAYKLVKGTKRNLTDIAITVLSLFPRALDKIQSTKKPFVYSIRHKANRLTYLSLKPIREVEPLPELFTKRPTKKTKKRKQTIKIDNSPTLFP
jgi:hypothetical protein